MRRCGTASPYTHFHGSVKGDHIHSSYKYTRYDLIYWSSISCIAQGSVHVIAKTSITVFMYYMHCPSSV